MPFRPTAAPGLSAIRLRAALATPSSWQDALVSAVGDGTIVLSGLDGSVLVVRVPEGSLIETGEPVAVHALYDVLAVGGDYRAIQRLG